MIENLRISSEPKAADQDVTLVKNALYAFNMDVAADRNPHPINLFVRDDAGVIYGGLLANCWGQWCHIDFLWLSEVNRNQGFGTTLMAQAEADAIAFGCRGAYLETFTFQARPFYERHGYKVVGEITDFPPGQSFYWMSKIFDEKEGA